MNWSKFFSECPWFLRCYCWGWFPGKSRLCLSFHPPPKLHPLLELIVCLSLFLSFSLSSFSRNRRSLRNRWEPRERDPHYPSTHTTRDNNWSNSSDRSNTHTNTHTHTRNTPHPFHNTPWNIKAKKGEEKGKGWLLSFWPNPIKIWEMRLEVVTLGWLCLFSFRFGSKTKCFQNCSFASPRSWNRSNF